MGQKISVCIPAYNEEKTIERCLASVVGQKNIEIGEVLVGTNSSTDRTGDIVRAFGSVDKRVKVIESRKGKPNAWNALNAAAHYNLRVFQDGDCIAPPDAYARLITEMGECDIIGASIKCMPGSRSIIARILAYPKKQVHPYPLLNGGLYVMDIEKVAACLSQKTGDAIMPSDVINDDVYLQILCRNVTVSNSVFICIESAPSLAAEIKRYRRMELGLKLLEKNYPVEFGAKLDRESRYSKFDALRMKISYMSPSELLLAPFMLPVRFLLYRYIHSRLDSAIEKSVEWK